MKLTVMALLCAAGLTSGSASPAPAPAPDRDGRDLVAAAQQAMTDGRFDEALDLYGKAGELLPLRAEIPYNMGVAAYRQGDLARAAELFDQARLLTSDPSMQARSAYNLGTTAARSALDSQEQDAAIAKTQMQDATDSLKSSLDHFRQAIEADPGDVDARANGELAWRWLQQLEEQMEQQGQQQQDSGQDPDENSDENQDQQQPPQDNQDQGESQDQQQQDQPQPSPGEGDEQQQQQGDQGEQQEQEEQQPTAQQQEQSQQDERPDTSERKPMTLEEADRLLQNVRDKEARRREELARQEASRRRPVDKDW